MKNRPSPFDLRFTVPEATRCSCPGYAARLRGIYPETHIARHAGCALANALGWAFLEAAPALLGADLVSEHPLLDILSADGRARDCAYGLVLQPGGPRYVIVCLSYAWPLVRYASPGAPDSQIAELVECLRLGFGQG